MLFIARGHRALVSQPTVASYDFRSRRVRREEIERREVEGQGLEEPCGDIDGTVIEIS